jgi:C4-dicarboxylate-specific signal transduction histidine kinase
MEMSMGIFGTGATDGLGLVVRQTSCGALIERKLTEEAFHQAQAELAHVACVATLRESTASIVHAMNQALAAIVANTDACLRAVLEVTHLGEARGAGERIVRDISVKVK